MTIKQARFPDINHAQWLRQRRLGEADITLISAHLEWLRLGGAGPVTVKSRMYAIARLRAIVGRPLLEATGEDLLAWRAGLALATNSLVSYVSHVHQFYAWAVSQGLLAASPAERLPVPRRPRMLPRPIPEDELMSAVIGAPQRIRPWLVLAGWCGLRSKEIALLRREHVLDARPAPLLRVATDATKGQHERLVPMSAFVLAELRPHLRHRGWVFPRGDGLPGPMTAAHVSHLANEYLHECGTASTLHALRHRFATQVYAVDRDLRAVQELLGHQSPQSTAGYAAYDQASASAAVEAIPAPGRLTVVR